MYPIILFTYNRPEHTLKVLEALKKNTLAEQSHLHIFVDGPKKEASEDIRNKIQAVKDIIKSDKWCGSVEYHIAEKNIGCRDSIIQGISKVLETNEAVIVLEDDIVTSPHFLTYMNAALEFYKNRNSVFSISGWNYPENKLKLPKDYNYDVYLSLRLLNWGWGTWKNRWEQVDWDKSFIKDFIEDEQLASAFDRAGDDMTLMLKEEYEGKSDAWDIQFAYNHFKQGAYSIVPTVSYTHNIGLDGTGVHCNSSDSLSSDLSKCKSQYLFLDNLYLDSRIVNAFYNVNCSQKRPLWQKVINYIARKIGINPPFVIKKKIYN